MNTRISGWVAIFKSKHTDTDTDTHTHTHTYTHTHTHVSTSVLRNYSRVSHTSNLVLIIDPAMYEKREIRDTGSYVL